MARAYSESASGIQRRFHSFRFPRIIAHWPYIMREVAQRLAERLGFGPEIQRNLGQLYERWDGKGLPRGLKGEAVALAVRIVAFAQDAIVLRAAFGAEGAAAKIAARRGGAYEPRLVDLYLDHADTLTAGLDGVTWSDVQALAPEIIAGKVRGRIVLDVD